MLATKFVCSIRPSRAVINRFVNFPVLQAYQKNYGDFNVPDSFVVGQSGDNGKWQRIFHGFQLGQYVQLIRKYINDGIYDQQVINQLQSFGFHKIIYSKNDLAVITAAKVFVKKNSHGVVPISFEIGLNDETWPIETRGLLLGQYCHQIAKSKKHHLFGPLREVGIDIPRLSGRNELTIEALNELYCEAVLKYKELFGTPQVPDNYVIPLDDVNFAPEIQGKNLGNWLLRHSSFDDKLRPRLASMGVDVCARYNRYYSIEVIHAAAIAFTNLHGYVNVPYKFIVPYHHSVYPEKTWGLPLGRILSSTRYRSTQRRQQLIDMGVLLKPPRKRINFEMLQEALKVYQSIAGDVKVKDSFQIGQNDERFHEDVRGLNLGLVVKSIRIAGTFKFYRNKLEALGIDYSVPKVNRSSFQCIFSALSTFHSINGHVNVPCKFTIVKGNTKYPEETWGLSLGEIMANIRNHGNYSKHREQLLSLGVKIKDVTTVSRREKSHSIVKQISPFDNILCALKTFESINGHVNVPSTFIIAPGDTQYPKETWGLGLGGTLVNIRNHGAYSEHRQELIELGVNFMPLRIKNSFEDIHAALLVYRHYYGDLNVPSTYQIDANDERFSEKVRGTKFGRVVQGIRCGVNYKTHRDKLEALGINYDVQRKPRKDK